ncbi:MAG: IS4 family transposase [Caldithrix sp.]|nr:IS4 family transposase [Caldithrix sp.]
MIRHASLFSQLIGFFDRNKFRCQVVKHKSERYSKGFKSWDQFVAMLFCQLAQAKSLREISGGLACCMGKLRHLGISEAPKKSTLSYANKKRDWRMFRDLFYETYDFCRESMPGKHKFRFKNKLLSLDSTTISLCLNLFPWAEFRRTKGAVKLHLLLDHDGYLPSYAYISNGKTHESTYARKFPLASGSIVTMDRGYNDYKLFSFWTAQGVYFVTRLKENADYEVISERELPLRRNILSDQTIRFKGYYARKHCPSLMRRVVVWDAENQKELVLLTNHHDFGATTISAIYKDRWQIELFFKAIKQNLKIKTFVGTSENALYIQIWTALIAMLLIKFLQLKSKFAWSLSNLVAFLRWNLFAYKDLWEWIDKPFEVVPETPPPMQMELPFKGV